MSASAVECARPRSVALARLRDYTELSRPKIAAFSLMTVAVGAVLGAWGMPSPAVFLHVMLATTLLAVSASSLNQYLERHRDLRMRRTLSRPLPAGRLRSEEVLVFGLLTGLSACLWLLAIAGWVASLCGLATWTIYVAIYTPLKSRTTANTAVGAVAGALPLAIGWFAVGGTWNIQLAALLVLLYLWQFPHFMAIAWLYRYDYAAAGLRMLPAVDATGERAGWQALLASVALLAVSAAPCLWILGGPMYLLGAMIAGLAYVVASARFLVRRDDGRARQLLRISLVYLPSVFALLVLAQLW